jgi:hypothetical protein
MLPIEMHSNMAFSLPVLVFEVLGPMEQNPGPEGFLSGLQNSPLTSVSYLSRHCDALQYMLWMLHVGPA